MEDSPDNLTDQTLEALEVLTEPRGTSVKIEYELHWQPPDNLNTWLVSDPYTSIHDLKEYLKLRKSEGCKVKVYEVITTKHLLV